MKRSPAVNRIGLMVIAVVVFCALASSSCSSADSRLMSPTEAFGLIQKNKGNPQFVVLDVRTPEEFKSGRIEGAINIDINSNAFKDGIGKLDRGKTYLVYCRTGRRSGEAVKIMRDLGFRNLLRFEGDIVKWRAEKLPLVM